MTRSYATPVVNFPSRRQAPRTAILITGADGQFVAIEPLADSDDLPADQLAVRAKRLFKGQRAQLISYTVTLEA
jgi:hypothetical protein